LKVHRPTGAPIPREEPEAKFSHVPKTTASREAEPPPLSGPPKSRGGALKRGEAPMLEFGAHTGGAPIYAETSFGNDASERQLIAQIQGKDVEPPPTTTRDPEPPISHIGSYSQPPSSPKAASPPPPPMRIGSVTDVSPNLPMFAPRVPEIDEPTPFSPPVDMTPARAFDDLDDDDDDSEPSLDLLDRRRPSIDPDATPIAPAVLTSDAERTPDPPLAQPKRVVTPPPLPAFIIPPVSSKVSLVPDTRPHPQSEQQISVAPHKPPSSRSDHSRVLPSVIVDVSSEYVELVEKVIAGPDEEAEASLLRAGGYAMPAIGARFPGPISIDEERLNEGPLPRVAECGPVIRLIASQRRTALPFVLAHIEDPDIDKRFWATYLLTELVYPDAIDAAIARVFDDEGRVRRAARSATRALAETHPTPVVERLGEVAKDPKGLLARRVLAVEALGETRESSVAGVLLALLEGGGHKAELATAIRAALVTVTRQDFGADTKKWSAWWAANKEHHRLEWLIDSLMHDHAALRAAAGEELKTITKEYFGYYDDLPKRERERAQSRYREWWNNIGRVRFSRAGTNRG